MVSGEGSITVSATPICVAWTLAELCPTCSVGQPLVLDTVQQRNWTLPEEVVSVRISGGTVTLTLDHDLDYTPLRAGELVIVAVSTGAGAVQEPELLRWELQQDLDSGSPVTFSHDFGGNPVTVSGGLRLQFSIATGTAGSRPQSVTVASGGCWAGVRSDSSGRALGGAAEPSGCSGFG